MNNVEDLEQQIIDKNIEKINYENIKLKDNIIKLNQIIEKLKLQIDELSKPPYFIATIIEIIDNNVIIKLHGNNQEIMTSYNKKLKSKLNVGTRVILNGAYNIINVIESLVDIRAQYMEIIEKPNIDYSMIGGLKEVLQEVIETVELPLTKPELFTNLGICPPSGILLYGPPGTGKTLIAKAVASKTKATFIRMSGSDLVQKFVGEGAKLVKDIFILAKKKAPTILFIDEIDAIGSIRTFDGTSGSSEVNRTMLQLLSEIDGFEKRGNIKIIAATNRIDLLDPALLRTGRFDRKIEVPMPNEEERKQILKIHMKNMNIDKNINLDDISKLTENLSGSDLSVITTEAGMFALRKKEKTIKNEHFLLAINKIKNKKTKNIIDQMFT